MANCDYVRADGEQGIRLDVFAVYIEKLERVDCSNVNLTALAWEEASLSHSIISIHTDDCSFFHAA